MLPKLPEFYFKYTSFEVPRQNWHKTINAALLAHPHVNFTFIAQRDNPRFEGYYGVNGDFINIQEFRINVWHKDQAIAIAEVIRLSGNCIDHFNFFMMLYKHYYRCPPKLPWIIDKTVFDPLIALNFIRSPFMTVQYEGLLLIAEKKLRHPKIVPIVIKTISQPGYRSIRMIRLALICLVYNAPLDFSALLCIETIIGKLQVKKPIDNIMLMEINHWYKNNFFLSTTINKN